MNFSTVVYSAQTAKLVDWNEFITKNVSASKVKLRPHWRP